MIPYIAVAMLLAAAALTTSVDRHLGLLQYGCLALVIGFTGLRFELGYDWIGYERLFEFVPDNWDFSRYQLSSFVLSTEPLFYGLNVTVKSLGGSFETLLFTLAAFNLFIIDRMCKKIAPGSQAFVWTIYFCVAMLAVQFNIIRQAAASSFVILALLSAVERKYVRSSLFFVIGLGFHVSILVFLPLLFFIRVSLSKKQVLILLIISLCLFSVGLALGIRALETVGGWLPEFIGSKTDNYIQGFESGVDLAGISPFSLALILAYLFILQIFLRAEPNRYVNVAIHLTLLVLFAHISLAEFPSFWNRVMCVSLPWQLATLWGIGYFKTFSPGRRIALISGGITVAIATMSYQLSRPENLPFVPYHSLIQVWAFGDQGDGRARAEDTVRKANLPG